MKFVLPGAGTSVDSLVDKVTEFQEKNERLQSELGRLREYFKLFEYLKQLINYDIFFYSSIYFLVAI